ncbi:MAG: N-acetylneuraminate synthase family protein [Phycisphaerales bacterium]
MRIGPRQIGNGAPPYIIAEIGVNHDGSAERALELIDAAADAAADAVKLQLFQADLLLSDSAELAGYQQAAGEQSPREMLRRLELPLEAMPALVERAHARGLHAVVTPFSVPLVGPALAAGFDAIKIASPDLINLPLLRAVERTGLPMIVSTGASYLNEVSRAAGWLREAAGRTAWLQCVSSYPARDEDASILAMEDLRTAVDGPVGYSDHTTGVDTGAVAAALGASVLEKHLTWSTQAPGPDHAASLEPDELRAYAALAREEGLMRDWMAGTMPTREDPRWGSGRKEVLPCEEDVRRLSRQSLVTTRALRPGDKLREEDIAIKRPGTGVEPWRLEEFLRKAVIRKVPANWLLSEDDVAW